jgi:predicted phage-related endonuclease
MHSSKFELTAIVRIIHDLVQGSPEWQQFRLEHFGASEAAAMLGISSKVSRSELLHMKHTGTAKEFSDWVQKNILDHGHEVEAMARPLAEELIGTELYPVTCSLGLLSASCDGLTMAEDVAFEHKQWNESLATSVGAGVLPDEYMPQCQQIMMVTGCQNVLFVVSDGTLDRFVSMVVEPSAEWQERIRAGWAQFAADLANYEPKDFAPKPSAEPIMTLPALLIQIEGRVATSNLSVFREKAEAYIATINTELATDEDFANAEATIKFCDGAEKSLEQAKAAALEQTADIAELMRTIDHIGAQLREKRLSLDKLVKSRKQAIKDEILSGVQRRFAEHVAALNAEIEPLRLVFQARDFAGAMKNKRTLTTLHDAVDTELANAKIAVDAIAKAVRGRLTWYREYAAGHEFLFADLQTVIQKPDDDFQLAVRTRIEEHKAKEAARIERERAEAAAAAEPVVDQVAPVVLNPAAAWPFPTGQEARPGQLKVAHSTPTAAPSLRLGQIAERLGFPLTAEFLNRLGFAPAATDKSAKFYHESSFPYICAALMRHIADAKEQHERQAA